MSGGHDHGHGLAAPQFDACCGHDHGHDRDHGTADTSALTPQRLAAYRLALWGALGLNVTMFIVEMVSGLAAGSASLQADALDFLGDSFAYGVTLLVAGMALRWRASVAMIKALSMLGFGAWVIGLSVYHAVFATVPLAIVMGSVGFGALLANLGSAALLYRYRVGDANMRAIWLCTRNDAIGNIAVMTAALVVGTTETGWADYLVAIVMACLALNAGFQVLRLSWSELHRPAAAG